MKRIISLLALIAITNLPISCGLGCGPFDTRPYKIVSLSSQIGSVIEEVFVESFSSNYDTAAIRVVVDEAQQVGWNNNSYSGLLNSAYACSPPDPNVQILTLIEITSNKSVFVDGIEFESGGDLESVLKIVGFDSELNVVDFNDSSRSGFNLGGFKGEDIMFQLISKPDFSISQEFTFTFTFDDGLEYQVQTPVFSVD